MQSTRGIIISSNEDLVAELDAALAHVTSSLYVRRLPFPDEESQLAAVLKSFAPSIVFLDMSDVAMALQLARVIRRWASGAHLVGIVGDHSPEYLLAAVRGGLRDILTRPLSLDEVHKCLSLAFSLVGEAEGAANHRRQILSFVPAKAGSGASTVAVHTACAMASFGSARVALMDLDFETGVIDLMLKLPFNCGLTQVAEYASCMDETIWARAVAKFGELNVLRAGSDQGPHKVSPREMGHLIDYARGNYDVICVDLPGATNELHMSVLEQSDLIFIVCTPDMPSVHLARRRMTMLREMNLDSRVKIIYNRAQANSPLSRTDVEDVLGSEVFAIIDNDFGIFQRAIVHGRPVDMDTPLGRTYAQLVNRIIGVDARATESASGGSRFWAGLMRLFRPTRRTTRERYSTRAALPAPPEGVPVPASPRYGRRYIQES